VVLRVVQQSDLHRALSVVMRRDGGPPEIVRRIFACHAPRRVYFPSFSPTPADGDLQKLCDRSPQPRQHPHQKVAKLDYAGVLPLIEEMAWQSKPT
jgi:hypothetical protein